MINLDDLFIVVLTTYKYKETRQKSAEETWLSGVQNYIFASDKDEGRNIKLSNRSDYKSAEEKQINSILYLRSLEKQYKYYLFVDDDTYVNLDNLLDFLNKNEIDTAGQVLSGETDSDNLIFKKYPGFKYYSGGAGFLYNDNLFEKICENMFRYEETNWGDVSLGLIVQRAGIQIKNYSVLFYSQSPWTKKHEEEQIKKSITYHYIKENDMLKLHNIIKNKL